MLLPRVVCQTYGQSIGRAIAGEGIALASCTLLREELASSVLLPLGEERHKTGKGYFLVKNMNQISKGGVSELVNFLSLPDNI
jgi:LysR family glycine cleavage system transcriptional activator